MKQIRKKNKTKQSVVWPSTSYFTIKELYSLNLKFVPITLRVRLTNAIEEGKIAEIGSVPGGKGRPQKVFALTPVTQIVLNKAEAASINLVDNAKKLVNVVSVTTTRPVTSSPVMVTAPNSSVSVS